MTSDSKRAFRTVRLDQSAFIGSGTIEAFKDRFRPVLVVVQGNQVGRRVPLGSSVVIGRDPDLDFALTDEGVSWHHARIEDRGDSWAVVDLGSTNGTFVNGEPCKDRVLEPNDKVMLARAVVRFEVSDALDQEYDKVVERLLNIDDLSGLYVRRKFDEELAALLARAEHSTEPVGLLVMDLDGIKSINDTHGHLFGAHVIGEAGRVIGRTICDVGFAARFGGDEFVAALHHCNLTESVSWGERILRAIRQHQFVYEDVVLKPGISIGVSAYPGQATTAQLLFEQADRALYRAKRSGKGCVRI